MKAIIFQVFDHAANSLTNNETKDPRRKNDMSGYI